MIYHDCFIDGKGNDTLTVGKGADVFDFTSGFGVDIIKDYVAGTDKLKFTEASSNVLIYPASIKAANVGSDTVIYIGNDELTLEG